MNHESRIPAPPKTVATTNATESAAHRNRSSVTIKSLRLLSYLLIAVSFMIPLIIHTVRYLGSTGSSSQPIDIMSLYISLVVLAFGFIIDRASENLAAEEDRAVHANSTAIILDSIQDQVTRIDKTLRYTFNVETLHTAKDWMDAATDLAESATLVRNTFITVGDKNQLSPEVSSLYDKFLSRPDQPSWKDIVSINELYSGRYDAIKPIPCNGSHEIIVLRHGIPLTNFTVFSFADRLPVALFGWAYGKHHSPGKVFRTSDPDLVTMFENLFESVAYSKGIATIAVDYSKSMPERIYNGASESIVDKKGYWFTHAYSTDAARLSTALLKIDFVGGSPRIEGLIGGADGEEPYEPIHHTSDRLIHHSDRAIYAEYIKNEGHFKVMNGFVMYSFSHEDGKDVISGFFVDDRFDNRRVEILGVRYNNPEHIMTGSLLAEVQEAKAREVESVRIARSYRRRPSDSSSTKASA